MKDLIKVILIVKKARLKEMEGYILNTTLQLECRFLRAEIAALEKELYPPRLLAGQPEINKKIRKTK